VQVSPPVLPPAPVESATTLLLNVRLPNGVRLEIAQTSVEELETIAQMRISDERDRPFRDDRRDFLATKVKAHRLRMFGTATGGPVTNW
jgi:hypothetical protein